MKWTDEQIAVHEFMAGSQAQNGVPLAVSARAGSGKTGTMVHGAVHHLRWAQRVLFTSLTKNAVREVGDRVARVSNEAGVAATHVETSTFHSIGLRALGVYWREMGYGRIGNPNDNKSYYVAKDTLNDANALRTLRNQQAKRAIFALKELLDKGRLNLVPGHASEEQLIKLCETYTIPISEVALAHYQDALRRSVNVAHTRGFIDFTDMIYLCHVEDVTLPKYDAVIVDEAQDMSLCSFNLALRCTRRFFTMIGDARQAIYLFAGARGQAWEYYRDLASQQAGRDAVDMTLSYCWRCPTNVIELVNQQQPDIKIRAGAGMPNGNICVTESYGVYAASAGDTVLCRYNRPLIDLYFELIARGTRCYIKSFGKDQANAVIETMRAAADLPGWTPARMSDVLNEWMEKRTEELREQRARQYEIDMVVDQVELARAFVSATPSPTSIDSFIRTVEEVAALQPSPQAVTLSTIHSFKGNEADRVFILEADELPIQADDQEQWLQEHNLQYVALTRARRELVLVCKNIQLGERKYQKTLA